MQSVTASQHLQVTDQLTADEREENMHSSSKETGGETRICDIMLTYCESDREFGIKLAGELQPELRLGYYYYLVYRQCHYSQLFFSL